MKITRQQNKKFTEEQLYDYTIEEEGKKLQIKVNRSGDLLWLMDDQEPSDYAVFTITQENEYLYSLFVKLYIQIMRYQEVSKDDQDKQMSIAHYLLTNNGNITWYSDKDDIDETDVLSISKKEDAFELEFAHQDTDFPIYHKPGMFDICFAAKDSRYYPFNQMFMSMYRELQQYNPEYHQIHIDELDYAKKKTKSK